MSKRWGRWRRWLAPGIGIKRWGALIAVAVLIFGAGFALLINERFLTQFESAIFRLAQSLGRVTGYEASPMALGVLGVTLGVLATFFGLRGMLRSIDRVLFPSGSPTLVDFLREERRRRRGVNVVVLGGGTGLATLLRGLKQYSSNLTAVVTVFDDGGSSGRLRRELGILPPGDIRHCLVALAEAEPLMTKLFEYRFRGGALDGHAFGNLFIASLAGVTGDLELAVKETSKVLKIRGRVLPTTAHDVVLAAALDDGRTIEGESKITAARGRISRVSLRPADPQPLPDALEAIADADLIVLGPGSLYTSLIPNLLVPGVADAVRESGAPCVYICNVMTQPGETDGYSAADHVRAIQAHTGTRLFSHVILNTQLPQSRSLRDRYAGQGSRPVEPTIDELEAMGLAVLGLPLMSEEELLRHDPIRLADAVLQVMDLALGRPRRGRLRGGRRLAVLAQTRR